MGETSWKSTVRVATELRAAGVNVDLYYDNAKLEKQFKYAESKGARLAVMMGEDEMNRGVVKVKNLQTREQIEVKEAELLKAVIAR
ncbi:MAG: hypothetical protein JNK33_04045 [Candidatus Doudnabacteria bacterium]|nr:hypothetical protein [Candidatus Doudnabacteria bacterium]